MIGVERPNRGVPLAAKAATFPPPMHLPGSSFLLIAVFAAIALGCQPSIGDSCTLHTDCSATGNRICEPKLPGGYCTIFNCEPGSCPSEAVCVAYATAPSSKPECADIQQQRLQRTFCMKSCSSSSDCRSGYSCVDLSPGNYWGAAVAERGSHSNSVCTVSLSKEAKSASASALSRNEAEVCSPPLDASFPKVPDAAVLASDATPSAAADAKKDVRAPRPSDAALDGTALLDARAPRVDGGAP